MACTVQNLEQQGPEHKKTQVCHLVVHFRQPPYINNFNYVTFIEVILGVFKLRLTHLKDCDISRIIEERLGHV